VPAWRVRWFILPAFLPCLAHLPELSGWISCNPLYFFAGLQAVLRTVLHGGCYIDGNAGTTLQALGGLSAENWLHASLPWWNPYAGVGLPLASEAQPASFFLPFVLLLHFFDGILYLKLVLQMLSGIFTLACLLEMGITPFAAILGAAVFALNGSFAWFSHSPILPIAFLPLLIFGIERSLRLAEAARGGGQATICLAIGYSLVAGFPETAFLDGLFGLFWCGCAIACASAAARPRLVAKIAVGGLCGLAISAPAIIPFLQDLAVSTVGPHVFVALDRLRPTQAITLLLPGFYGPPSHNLDLPAWADSGGYFGAAASLLALGGLLRARRNAWRRWLAAGWVLFWLCAAFGEPVCHFIWRVTPVLSQAQFTRYGMPSMAFGACVLLAACVDDWCRAGHTLPRGAWVILSALLALCLFLAWRGHHLPEDIDGALAPYALASLACGISAVLAAVYLLRRAATRRRAAGLAFVLMLESLSQFMLPIFCGTRPVKLDFGAIAYLRAHAGTARIYSISPALTPDYGGYFGISSLREAYVPLLRVWADYQPNLDIRLNDAFYYGLVDAKPSAAETLSARRAAFEAVGTGYVIVALAGDPIPATHDNGFVSVYEDAIWRIYALPHAAPYVQASADCEVALEDRLRQHVVCTGPGSLLRRELMVPGWQARIDDRKAPIATVDGIFQRIALPAGAHTVQWRYVPQRANLIAWLFGLGVAGLACFAGSAAWVSKPKLGRAGGKARLRLPATNPDI
jgi:hypothetical protein